MGLLEDLAHILQENFSLTCSSAEDRAKATATATPRNEEAGRWGEERGKDRVNGDSRATSWVPQVPMHLGEKRKGRESD